MKMPWTFFVVSIHVLCPCLANSADIERDCLRELAELSRVERLADRNNSNKNLGALKRQINQVSEKGCWKFKEPSPEEIERQKKFDEQLAAKRESSKLSGESTYNYYSAQDRPTHAQLMNANGRFSCKSYTVQGFRRIVLILETDNYGTYAINGTARGIASRMGWKDGKDYFTNEEMTTMVSGLIGRCQ